MICCRYNQGLKIAFMPHGNSNLSPIHNQLMCLSDFVTLINTTDGNITQAMLLSSTRPTWCKSWCKLLCCWGWHLKWSRPHPSSTKPVTITRTIASFPLPPQKPLSKLISVYSSLVSMSIYLILTLIPVLTAQTELARALIPAMTVTPYLPPNTSPASVRRHVLPRR